MAQSPVTSRAFSTRYEDHIGLLTNFSIKGYMRLQSAGVVVDREDVYQEMCVAFVQAQKKWNSERGISFTAYMGRAVWNEFNEWAEKQINSRRIVGSIDDLDLESPDEIIGESYGETNEEIAQRRQVSKELMSRLSVPAKRVLLELMQPSKGCNAAYRDMVEAVEQARARGMKCRKSSATLDLNFIMNYHQISKESKQRLYAEFKSVLGVSL